jgi:hypothetical protein
MYLFEKVEESCNEIKKIEKNLDFLFNSFCKAQREINGLGINIWHIDTKEIEDFLTKEEPRIFIHSVIFEEKILTILFEFNDEILERSYL